MNTELDKIELNMYSCAARMSDFAQRVLYGEQDYKDLTMNESDVFGIQVITGEDFDDLAYFENLDLATARRMGDFFSSGQKFELLHDSECIVYFSAGESFCHGRYRYYLGQALIVRESMGFYLPIDEETEEKAIKEFKQKLVTIHEGDDKIIAYKTLMF